MEGRRGDQVQNKLKTRDKRRVVSDEKKYTRIWLTKWLGLRQTDRHWDKHTESRQILG
jgi:hypothetical protein